MNKHTRRVRAIWRWNTGSPMDGEFRTDAGWFTKGRHAYHRTGKVYSWHYLPRIIRMGVRWAVNVTVLGMLLGLVLNWRATLIALSVYFIAASIAGSIFVIRKFRKYWENTRTVTPIAEGLADRLGISAQVAEDSLTLKPGYREITMGPVGSFRIPNHFGGTGGEMHQVETVISSRLPHPLDYKWKLSEGKGGLVTFRAVPPLPTMARLMDYLDEVRKLKEFGYIAGVTASGLYKACFVGPEPHHGHRWGTGVGKSSFLSSILAQFKLQYPEGTAKIVDPKDISLAFLHGVPGFEFYENSPQFDMRIQGLTMDNYMEYMPDMWKGIKSMYDLMCQRADEMKRDRTKEFQPHLNIIDESNSFGLMSKVWWLRNRPRGAATTVPIWGDWIAPLFWRARQFGIYNVIVGQSFQERFLGNLNLRPSLGLVSLAKFKPSDYDSIIGTTPVPRSQKGVGRALFNDGERDQWVQCLYATEAEAREICFMGLAGKERERVPA